MILLRHWGWNKDKLIEAYMESPEKCNVEAGLEVGRQPRLKRMRGFTCEVCFDEDGTKETIALSCNHRFCRDCYAQYLNQKIAYAYHDMFQFFAEFTVQGRRVETDSVHAVQMSSDRGREDCRASGGHGNKREVRFRFNVWTYVC